MLRVYKLEPFEEGDLVGLGEGNVEGSGTSNM